MFAILDGLLFAAVCSIGAVIGLFALKKFIPVNERCHEVAGHFLGVMGILYAILLGFLISNSLSRFVQAQTVVENETGSIAQVFRVAGALPKEASTVIRNDCINYLNLVIDKEWALMSEQKTEPEAWLPLDDIWKTVLTFKPTDFQQHSVQESLIHDMKDVCKARHVRLLYASTGGLTPILWTVLVAGAIVLTISAYLFELENKNLHIILVVLLSFAVSINFYLLLDYSYPFAGIIAVKDDSFVQIRKEMQQRALRPEF